jgi:hypothetical protein
VKNITTPRTLAECQWTSGYPQAHIGRRDRIGGCLLAIAMGLAAAVLIVWEWSA